MNHAAGMLQNDNKFFRHACIKGMKGGDYSLVSNLFRFVFENIDELIALV